MTPDEQESKSKKYLAIPIYIIPLGDARYGLFSGHTERKFVTSGTWEELEAFVPSLTAAAETPVWNKPSTPKAKIGKAELEQLLKRTKL